jgi:hypothetical protein
MIEMPKRSVTRFFIPLIDVLFLLFCIFLLMPMIQESDQGSDGKGKGGSPPPIDDPALLKEKLAALEKERQELQKKLAEAKQKLEESLKTLDQRVAIRVLEMDAKGNLYCSDPSLDGKRIPIDSPRAAKELIERQRGDAGNRELYYLFLYPRTKTGYPEQRQLDAYRSWFAGVPFGIDNPRAKRE